jgi:hypothetical protein
LENLTEDTQASLILKSKVGAYSSIASYIGKLLGPYTSHFILFITYEMSPIS